MFAETRYGAGLSVEDVAREFGVPLAVALEWETGRLRPPLHVVRSLDVLRGSLVGPPTLRTPTFDGNETTMIPMRRLPHPIPYQGSKRNLAPLIASYVPDEIETWYEPFAGSGAMTIWAAYYNRAQRYVIADSLPSMSDLWTAIIDSPARVSECYREVWTGQLHGDEGYFNAVRDRYNADRDPVDLLYLICRCVKNAVRFNRHGHFTQSRDKRRLGMQPDKMSASLFAVSRLLCGKTEVRCGDWLETTRDATQRDFIYMDPPYLGTSVGRDKRYAEQLEMPRLVNGLCKMRERSLRFALSYDGMTGGKVYGDPLPDELGLTRLLLHAGKSSQATLAGRSEETIESLYITPGLGEPVAGVIRRAAPQAELAFAVAS